MKSLETKLEGKFFEDLSSTIVGFLQKFDLPLYINGKKITQEEFVGETCLPFLLYDKQPMIDRMIEELNTKHGFLGYLIITFKNKSKRQSLANLYMNVEENISHKVEFQEDYRKIILALTKTILSQDDFIVENDKILLDNLMTKFLAAFDNGELLIENDEALGSENTQNDSVDSDIHHTENLIDNTTHNEHENNPVSALIERLENSGMTVVKLTDLIKPESLASHQLTITKHKVKHQMMDVEQRVHGLKALNLFKPHDSHNSNSKFLELPVFDNKFIKSVTSIGSGQTSNVSGGTLQIALPSAEEVKSFTIETIEQKVRKLTELMTLKDNLIHINERYGKHFDSPVIEEHLIYNVEKEIKQLAEDINNA